MKGSKSKDNKTYWFSQLDIFGSAYVFLKDGNEKFKSNSGAILTIIYCVIVVALFMGFGLDLYERKNPRVSFNTGTVPYFLQNMSNLNFTYAFRVEDSNGLQIENPSLFSPIIAYIGMEMQNGSWALKAGNYLQAKKCHDVANYTLKEDYYNISLKNWYCLDFDGVKIGGNWNGNFVYTFLIQILQCTNSTQNNNTCLSQEEMEKAFVNPLNGGNFFYSDLFLSIQPAMNNFTHPIGSTLVNNYEMLSLQFTKRKVQTFKTTRIDNDVGWFFPDYKEESTITSESIRPDFTMKDKWTQNVLYNTYLYLGNTVDSYNRSYTKVQEVIASIGGFAKFFHTALFFMHFSIGKVYKNLILIHALPFNEDSFALRAKVDSPKKAATKLGLLVFKKFEVRKNLDRPGSKIADMMDKVSYYAYFKRFVCRCNKNTSNNTLNKYKHYDRYFTKALDVVSYVKLYNQFKILKKVLMDKNQLLLFKLTKPELNRKKKQKEENYDKLVEYLNSLQTVTSSGSEAKSQEKESPKKKRGEKETISRNILAMMDRATKSAFSK